ncbi:uncharacterized protein LOC115937767 [Leptonychotes weddellii]|uniref:Uncharacterized protein LOC115937767 n=1 Tax=Leptonychotes weddellii TaxID=9713 RepID=A0A7F8Q7N8_LEPWE|nr:uncharacterized protein LOC115937767 [Leptonychotes weddellii]
MPPSLKPTSEVYDNIFRKIMEQRDSMIQNPGLGIRPEFEAMFTACCVPQLLSPIYRLSQLYGGIFYQTFHFGGRRTSVCSPAVKEGWGGSGGRLALLWASPEDG